MVLRIKKGTVSHPRAIARGWFFTHEGIEYGPVSFDQLRESLESGLLLPADQVWSDANTKPVTAEEVPDLLPPGSGIEEEASLPVAEPPERSRCEVQTPIRSASWPPPPGKGSVVCPYCWYRFDPENALYVAQHRDLVGDPLLGADEPARFRPDRFTPSGHAIDAGNMVCRDTACPYCHLRIPTSMLSMPPLFLSLVGAPASGKSFFLASMTWRLRTVLPQEFLVAFADADHSINGWINDYEERLFLQADATATQIIEKTQMELTGRDIPQGTDGKPGGQRSHYHSVNFDGMNVTLPKPVIFSLQSDVGACKERRELSHSLVLYDNAGEQFLPGNDTVDKPGSRHLACADAIMFLFDPTADPGFRQVLARSSSDVQLRQRKHVRPQHVLITESLNRVRLQLGMSPRARYEKPILVLISKSDVLGSIAAECLNETPWRTGVSGAVASLDISFIMRISYGLRAVLLTYAPQFVMAVESAASDVTYLPVSALGGSPEILSAPEGGDVDGLNLGVRPCTIRSKWVEVPLLLVLHRLGYLPGHTECDETIPVPEKFEIAGGTFQFTVPGTEEFAKVPVSYAGMTLVSPVTGTWFRVPE